MLLENLITPKEYNLFKANKYAVDFFSASLADILLVVIEVFLEILEISSFVSLLWA